MWHAMDIPKLLIGIALIVGYVVLRLFWTYKQDAKRRSKKQTVGERLEFGMLMLLGVAMLAAGLYFIVLSM